MHGAGADEGAFAWLTLNYLLGHLGEAEEKTVAAIDLGGGSVQQAFAIKPQDASKAPPGYITQLSGGGRSYSVYVHRWAHTCCIFCVFGVSAVPQGTACGEGVMWKVCY